MWYWELWRGSTALSLHMARPAQARRSQSREDQRDMLTGASFPGPSLSSLMRLPSGQNSTSWYAQYAGYSDDLQPGNAELVGMKCTVVLCSSCIDTLPSKAHVPRAHDRVSSAGCIAAA